MSSASNPIVIPPAPVIVSMPRPSLSRSVAVPYVKVWGTPAGCPDDKVFNIGNIR